MRSLLAHLLHLCQGSIAHSATSDLLPPVRLAVVSQISISLDAWRYVVSGCLMLCAGQLDASVELEPLMEQILVLAMRSSAPSCASSPEAAAAAFKELSPPNTEGTPFSCLKPDCRRILANIIARSVEAPLSALQPVAWEIHPSEGTACFLDTPGCVATSSVLLSILQMAADEHWSTRGKAATDVLQQLDRDEQQVVLSKSGASNLVVLLVDNALAAKSASEALTTMCTLLAHVQHVCPGGTTQSEFLASLPPVDLAPVSEVYINLGDWQYAFQGCMKTRRRWFSGSDGQEAVDLDHCVETVLSLALSCLDPRTGSRSEATTDALNLLLAHEGQEGQTEQDTFAILSPDDRHALASIIVQSPEAVLINLRPVVLQLHPHEDIAKHLLSEFASSPSSDLLLSIMRVAVAGDKPWSGVGKEVLSALQLMPLEAQERVLKDEKQEDGKNKKVKDGRKKKKVEDGGLAHLVLLLLADTATADDPKAALSSVSLVVSYLMLAHTAETTNPELLIVLPPAYVGLAGSLTASQKTWRLVVPKFLNVCEQWMEGADVETASQLELCIGQMLMMAMSPAGPGAAADNMSMGSKVWILQECLPSAKARRSPVVLDHAHKMLEALCNQVAASEHDTEDRGLAKACWKLIGWISERRILTSLTLSPPWLLPLLGTMCHSLATSHGGPSWTKDIPPELGGQTLLFAATTCSLQGHHKEVLQLMKQYLTKNKKLPNSIVDAALQACVHQQKWDAVSPEARTRMSLAAAELVLTIQPVNESSLCKVLDAYAVCAESALDHCSTGSDHPPEGILDPRFHCSKAEELVQRLCSETPATEEEEDEEEGTPPGVTPSALIYTALISVYAAAQQPTEAVQVAVNLSMASGALSHPCCKTLPALPAKPGQRALLACWWTRSDLPLPDWLEVVHCSMQVAASQGCYRGVSYLFQEALLQAGAVQHEGIIQEVQGCLPDDDQATSSPDQDQLLSDVIEALGEEGYYHMEDWEGDMLKADASWLDRLRVNNASSRKYVQDRMEELAQPWVAPSCDDAEEEEEEELEDEEERWTPYNDDGEDSKDEEVKDNAAESQPVDRAEIVAYFGGMAFKRSDQEWLARLYPNRKRQWYGSGADAGRQGLKTLIQSIKAGRALLALCRQNSAQAFELFANVSLATAPGGVVLTNRACETLGMVLSSFYDTLPYQSRYTCKVSTPDASGPAMQSRVDYVVYFTDLMPLKQYFLSLNNSYIWTGLMSAVLGGNTCGAEATYTDSLYSPTQRNIFSGTIVACGSLESTPVSRMLLPGQPCTQRIATTCQPPPPAPPFVPPNPPPSRCMLGAVVQRSAGPIGSIGSSSCDLFIIYATAYYGRNMQVTRPFECLDTGMISGVIRIYGEVASEAMAQNFFDTLTNSPLSERVAQNFQLGCGDSITAYSYNCPGSGNQAAASNGQIPIVLPILSIASPILSIASPILSIASPILCIASPILSIASPILSIASPILSIEYQKQLESAQDAVTNLITQLEATNELQSQSALRLTVVHNSLSVISCEAMTGIIMDVVALAPMHLTSPLTCLLPDAPGDGASSVEVLSTSLGGSWSIEDLASVLLSPAVVQAMVEEGKVPCGSTIILDSFGTTYASCSLNWPGLQGNQQPTATRSYPANRYSLVPSLRPYSNPQDQGGKIDKVRGLARTPIWIPDMRMKPDAAQGCGLLFVQPRLGLSMPGSHLHVSLRQRKSWGTRGYRATRGATLSPPVARYRES
eukprot:gene16623-22870_t